MGDTGRPSKTKFFYMGRAFQNGIARTCASNSVKVSFFLYLINIGFFVLKRGKLVTPERIVLQKIY
jgi:hypothetical protein